MGCGASQVVGAGPEDRVDDVGRDRAGAQRECIVALGAGQPERQDQPGMRGEGEGHGRDPS